MRNVIRCALIAVSLVTGGANAQFQPRFDLFAFNQRPSPYALEVFGKVQSSLSASDVEIFSNVYVPNAMATTMPEWGYDQWGRPFLLGVRKVVLYNPSFMTHFELSSASEWAAISIIAHEMGHHLAGHTNPQNPWEGVQHPWNRELEADYYSGEALAKLGANSEDLQRAQRLMFSLWGSVSHPDTVSRIQAINRGWMNGGGESIEADLESIWNEIQDDLTKWWY